MNILIIGGGAAGLMAAITASEGGHAVTLCERQSRVGRKLLSTGNGRCNLSHADLTLSHYHGTDPSFARGALGAFSGEETLRFFRSLGLLTVTEPGGRIYPHSDQAGSVVDVLRLAADARGVITRTGVEITTLEKRGDFFSAASQEGETFTADRVILCCGGMAGAKLGGTKSGYTLLSSFGHRRSGLYPALVQLRTDPALVRALKGIRACAGVTVQKDGEVLARSEGEVQFTDYGVSGPAIFEVSRAAVQGGEGTQVRLDLLNRLEEGEVVSLLSHRAEGTPDLPCEHLLTGILHNRLGRTLVQRVGLDLGTSLCALSQRDLERTARAVKDFVLPVTGNQGFDGAQVTAGGMLTDEFDPDTMESRLVPGLYAAGEVLDIDGDCGGYNLQWAWASGRLAGRLL